MKTRKKKPNKFKIIRTLTILLIILYVLFSNVIAKEERELVDYTVCQNDTIWSIAKEHKEEDEDIREYVYEIQKINNLVNKDLSDGQVIKIYK